MSQWIRKGDNVKVISGVEKGRTGIVLSIKGDSIVVQGLNLKKRHMKGTQERPKGEIVELEKPIRSSKVALCDPEGNALKIRVRFNEQNEKELYYKLNGEEKLHRLA